MPYLTTEQLSMLSDVLCLSFFGISVLIIFTMKTKRYGRRLAQKWIRKNGVNFNSELSLALNDVDLWGGGPENNGRKPRYKRKGFGEKGSKDGYAAARRLAEQGLNVEGISEKVNLPRNEIELIVKFRRMNMPRSTRDEQGRHRDYTPERLEALRSASEKIARAGVGRP